MKKSMLACCSALFALAVCAEEPTPPPAEAAAPKAPRAERGPRAPRGPRHAPLMLLVTDKTTAEEIETFKKNVLEKIDKSYADYKAKPAPEEGEKPVMHLGLMVMERRPGMGPGMRGPAVRGQGQGKGPRGPRGDRGPRRGGAGDKPATAPEAAAEAK